MSEQPVTSYMVDSRYSGDFRYTDDPAHELGHETSPTRAFISHAFICECPKRLGSSPVDITGIVGTLVSTSVDEGCQCDGEHHEGWCEGGGIHHMIYRCCGWARVKGCVRSGVMWNEWSRGMNRVDDKPDALYKCTCTAYLAQRRF